MVKRGFNEAERYVIKNWAASFELEQSMDEARVKYEQVWQRIVEGFTEAYPGYNQTRVRAVQISGNQPGEIWLAKKSWPKIGKRDYCGLWIENIRLEYVADEDVPPPLVSVWVKPLEEHGVDVLQRAKTRMAEEAQKVLPPDLLAKAPKSYPDNGYAVALELASKREFLEALADPDEERFIDLVRTPLDALAKLTPVLDELLGAGAATPT